MSAGKGEKSMSLFSKMKQIPRHLPTGTARGSAVKGFLVDKGERYAASYAFGWIKGHYRERAMFRGQPADLLAGGGALAVSVLLNVASGGRSGMADHLERIGDAGIQSYLNSLGASKGAQMAGRQVMVLPAGKTAKQSVVGALPSVTGNAAYLSPEEVENFSAARR